MKQEKIQKPQKEIEKVEKLAGEIKQESQKIIKEEKKLETETEKLKKELEEAKKLSEERLSQLKYLQADFDNYRKQFEKEREQIVKLANESLVKELIVILDDFESSIKLIENKEGIELLNKKFFSILEKHGLKKIEALGKKFNPNFHEVLCKELSSHDEDEIIEEIQRGYKLHSKVIRPSKVKISKKEEEKKGVGERRQGLKINEIKDNKEE
jgi:molecular chaperone GrpE